MLLSRTIKSVKTPKVFPCTNPLRPSNRRVPDYNIPLYKSQSMLLKRPYTTSTQISPLGRRNYQQDYETKYKLSEINDLNKIFSIIDHDEIRYSTNELAYFFKRIVDLVDGTNLLTKKHISSEIAHLVYRIKENLRDLSQEDVLIGTLAWCFWKLGYNDNQELWLTMGDYILDEKYHQSFDESVKAIEGFSVIKNLADEEYFDSLFTKLEKTCFFEMTNVNIDSFRRIAQGLIRANRSTDVLFNKMEVLMLKNLDLQYDPEILLEVLSAFSFSNHGSKELFMDLQEHVLPDPQKLKNGSMCQFIAKFLETYAIAKYRHPTLELDSSLREFFSKKLQEDCLCPNLSDIVKIKQNIDLFDIPNSDQIHIILDQKLFTVQQAMDPQDMVAYIDIIVGRDYNEEYKKLPDKISDFFDSYLNKNLAQQTPQGLYYYITESDKRRLITKKKELINNMIPYILARLRDHNTEQLSYYYSLFDEYYFLIDQKQIGQALSDLKDFIQYLCHRRGFSYD